MQMTKPNNNQGNHRNDDQIVDESLHALYQKRKRQHTSPNAVRQVVLNKLASNAQAKAPWWKINLKPYMQISAVVGSVAIAFIVVSLQMVNKQPPLVMLESTQAQALRSAEPMKLESANLADFQSVELHVLAPNTMQVAASKLSQQSATLERKIQYQSARNGYLARQADIEIHQQSFATIVNSDEGLSLLTCDHNLLKLSQDVVDLLMSGAESKTVDFSKGQMVALSFDRNGHIIYIRNQSEKTEC
jgi:hypothetical protein